MGFIRILNQFYFFKIVCMNLAGKLSVRKTSLNVCLL